MSAPVKKTREQHIADWLDERSEKRASRTKLGLRGYAVLAALLQDKPSAAREFGYSAGIRHTAAYRFLMSLHTLGWVHIVDWQIKPRTRPLAVFAFGPGDDVPPPTVRPDGRSVEAAPMPRDRLCAAVIAFVHLLRAVEDPARRVDLIAATGLHKDSVQEWMNACLDVELVHVACWHLPDHGGAPLPMIQIGPGINAKKPRVDRRERRQRITDRARMRRSFQPLLSVFGRAANEERRAA